MNTQLLITALDDTALIAKTKTLAAEERRLSAEVIHHIREIDRRRLFAARGYDSLFSFVVKELGFSDGAAYRRIGAMRVLSHLPSAETKDIEKSLTTGELSLSNLSQLQRFLVTERKEKQRIYSPAEKTDLIVALKSKSSREAERVLAAVSPDSVQRREVVRAVGATQTVIHFTADEALMAKLTRVREVLSHRLPNSSMAALLHEVLDVALKAADPMQKKTPPPADHFDAEVENVDYAPGTKDIAPNAIPAEPTTSTPKPATPRLPSPNPRYIPAKLRVALLQKAGGTCEYTDPRSKRRCEARHYLQIDHRKPVAHGGTAVMPNLRVLCAQHNHYEARRLGLVG